MLKLSRTEIPTVKNAKMRFYFVICDRTQATCHFLQLTDFLHRWSWGVFLCSVTVFNEKRAQLQPWRTRRESYLQVNICLVSFTSPILSNFSFLSLFFLTLYNPPLESKISTAWTWPFSSVPNSLTLTVLPPISCLTAIQLSADQVPVSGMTPAI